MYFYFLFLGGLGNPRKKKFKKNNSSTLFFTRRTFSSTPLLFLPFFDHGEAGRHPPPDCGSVTASGQ
jgi:hypothetical protein